ncbi:guanylate kinase [uncultured Lamprocystis sp.]|jgi:guanylate kinase|uniref:guanylate kinase n=3 Tax=uncultured Lamprocystis sp. TaxID=543132 RepID=UPI0025DCF3BD|nr:guanylate kinase [uncultured Lamprocystis sp.]
MHEGILFIVSAPSGAGKTSLVKALLERDPHLALSVSVTTRPPRPGERDGVHYHFRDLPTLRAEIAAGAFIEYAEVYGNLYGTREADVRLGLRSGRGLILEIDWQGARQVRARFPQAVGVFILPPSWAELERRLCGRGTDSEAVIARRLAEARADMAHWSEYDYVVINDHFNATLADLAAIVAAERLRAGRRRGQVERLFADLPPVGLDHSSDQTQAGTRRGRGPLLP